MEPTNDLSVRELKSFIVSRGGDPSLCSEKSELLALAKQLATPVAPVTGPLSHESTFKSCEDLEELVTIPDDRINSMPAQKGFVMAYSIQKVVFTRVAASSVDCWLLAIAIGSLSASNVFKIDSVIANKSLGQDLIRDYRTIKEQIRHLVKKSKPELILFDDRVIFQEISPWLQKSLGIPSRFEEKIPAVAKYCEETAKMMSSLDYGLSVGNLLEVPDVTPDFLKEWYAACAYLYRKAPWKQMDNYQSFICKVGDQPERTFSVMGFGGEETGLSVYDSPESFRAFLKSSLSESHEELMKVLEKGVNTMSYEGIDAVRIQDVVLAFENGWEVPDNAIGTRAFPTPRCMSMQTQIDGHEKPPSKEWLIFYQAVARTFPSFVAELTRTLLLGITDSLFSSPSPDISALSENNIAILPYDPERSLRQYENKTGTYAFKLNPSSDDEPPIQVTYRYPALIPHLRGDVYT